jgi:DNA-binding HxlR family transcriptional regulator
MAIIRGVLEMLELADGKEPKSFNDFTRISINHKRLSSATVSKRLDELLAVDAMEEVVVRSKSGRRVIAYKTTEKGRRVIELARELKEALTLRRSKTAGPAGPG